MFGDSTNVPTEIGEHGSVLIHNVVWACIGSCVCVTALEIKIAYLFTIFSVKVELSERGCQLVSFSERPAFRFLVWGTVL